MVEPEADGRYSTVGLAGLARSQQQQQQQPAARPCSARLQAPTKHTRSTGRLTLHPSASQPAGQPARQCRCSAPSPSLSCCTTALLFPQAAGASQRLSVSAAGRQLAGAVAVAVRHTVMTGGPRAGHWPGRPRSADETLDELHPNRPRPRPTRPPSMTPSTTTRYHYQVHKHHHHHHRCCYKQTNASRRAGFSLYAVLYCTIPSRKHAVLLPRRFTCPSENIYATVAAHHR